MQSILTKKALVEDYSQAKCWPAKSAFCNLVKIIALTSMFFATGFSNSVIAKLSNNNSSEIINFNHLNSDDGLSQNLAYRIIQDHVGFIWIATQDGLNRYDGKQFLVFRSEPENSASLLSNDVRMIFEDSNQRLWVGSQGKGISHFNRADKTFSHISFSKNEGFDSANIIVDMVEGQDGLLWIGTRGGLVKFDPNNSQHRVFIVNQSQTERFGNRIRDLIWLDNTRLLVATDRGLRVFNTQTEKFSNFVTKIDPLSQIDLAHLVKDRAGNIWVGSFSGDLFRIDENNLLAHKRTDGDPSYPSNELNLDYHVLAAKGSELFGRIRSLYEDRDGTIWVGTRAKGLFYFDQRKNIFINFRNEPGDRTSINDNNIMDIFQDRTGLFWIGTWSSGVNTFNQNNQGFQNFVSIPYKKNSLSGKNVWAILQTRDGNYWFGTNEGGLTRYNVENGQFVNFRHSKEDPQSLSGNRVWAIAQREDGMLWVGTYFSGLNLFDPQSGKVIKRYSNEKDSGQTKAPKSVINMLKTHDGSWWFATRFEGLARLRPGSNNFDFYKADINNPNSLNALKVFALFEDSQKRLWVGTETGGLSLYRAATDDFRHYRKKNGEPQSMLSDEVLSLAEDTQGNLLVGTEQGLSRMISDGIFEHITVKQGLINSTINGILVDCEGVIWLSTNKSLSSIDDEGKIVNYANRDGLISTEFNTTAYQNGKNCKLLFGGDEGAVIFVPKTESVTLKPALELTDILKYYQSMNTNVPLEQVSTLQFSYRDRVISFVFALMDFNNPAEHRFAYRLIDNESSAQWIDLGYQNQVHLSNLEAGSHVLEIKGQSEKGLWSNVRQINITITPPWWQSLWAYFVYSLSALAIVVIYLYLQQQRLKAQKKLAENERQVAEKLRRLDKLKDEFLANTSHELRTPLNAIIGLSSLALQENMEHGIPEEQSSYLQLIRDSGDHLLKLVTDILDYSALNEKKLLIKSEPVAIKPLIENLVLEMNLLNENAEVVIESNLKDELPLLNADPRRLYQILLNLLSNAVKFTSQGRIEVKAEKSNLGIKISVSDTGIGIAQEQLESIFNRFEQLDGTSKRRYGGAGLGLAITRELVELHNGRIAVSSKEGFGSIFTIELPFG